MNATFCDVILPVPFPPLGGSPPSGRPQSVHGASALTRTILVIRVAHDVQSPLTKFAFPLTQTRGVP